MNLNVSSDRYPQIDFKDIGLHLFANLGLEFSPARLNMCRTYKADNVVPQPNIKEHISLRHRELLI